MYYFYIFIFTANFALNIVDCADEDSYLNASHLIQKYNYPYEEHTVTTKDGYVLTVQRIVRENKPVILLQHGSLDSSDTWLINSPNSKNCLAFILFDAGYDVWLANSRGNKYATNHTTLDTAEAEFWRFSFDEMGFYDLPATIDFILLKTRMENFIYIGHSQGTTAGYALCSRRPEYNSKIKLMISLAPAAWATYNFSPFVSKAIAKPLSKPGIMDLMQKVGLFALPYSSSIADTVQVLCRKGSLLQSACETVVFEFFGYDTYQLNSTRLPVYMSHYPVGGSLQEMVHYFQMKYSQRFCRFDHGVDGNVKLYGSKRPPEYDIDKITVPIALFHANNDYVAPPEGVKMIKENFPNIVYEYLVPFEKFNHMDFLWALDAPELVYKKVIELLSNC